MGSLITLALVLLQGSPAPAAPQDECPAPADFQTASPQRIAVRSGASPQVWQVAQEALDDWYGKASARTGAKSTAPARPVLQQFDASLVRGAPVEASGTCFVELNGIGHPNIEHRIAFLLAVLPGSASGERQLEVRWVGENRGRAERIWRSEAEQSARLALELIDVLRSKLGR